MSAEQVVIPLPCGHLVDDYAGPVATITCGWCGRVWRLTRKPGRIDAEELHR